MKRTSLILILTSLLTTSLGAKEYQVSLQPSFEKDLQQISLAIETLEAIYYPCPLEVTKITIKKPTMTPVLIDEQGKKIGMGEISLVVHQQMCPGYQTQAPAKGQVILQKGSELPSLTPGLYELLINDEPYGTLQTSQEDGVYTPSARL